MRRKQVQEEKESDVPTADVPIADSLGLEVAGVRDLAVRESVAPVGRPSDYTPEKAIEFCSRLAEGRSMRTVCKDDDMPSAATVFKWMRENEEFLKQYAHACRERSEAMAEEILDIADDGRNDWMEIEKKNGGRMVILDKEAVMRSKLRVEARQWLMSKMKPKKYGERLDVTSDGEKLPTPLLANVFINAIPSNDSTSQSIVPQEED